MYCNVVLSTVINPVTGQTEKVVLADPKDVNVDNKCIHFKKKWFKKEKDKKVCVDCARFVHEDFFY